MVARDFKGEDKDRDDLFAETPPLEAKRMLLSRAVTRKRDGNYRNLRFIDAKKAHLNPKCEEDVYIELPEECGAPPGMCGKLNFWLHGFVQRRRHGKSIILNYLSQKDLFGGSRVELHFITLKWM